MEDSHYNFYGNGNEDEMAIIDNDDDMTTYYLISAYPSFPGIININEEWQNPAGDDNLKAMMIMKAMSILQWLPKVSASLFLWIAHRNELGLFLFDS